MNKIVLVRSSRKLIEEGYIGYGWEKVKFNIYNSADELISKGFHEAGINYGRKRKQIMLYHSIKEDDIVVVPVGGAIAIGLATGDDKVYVPSSDIAHSNNRIKVKFFKNDEGKVLYVPRSELATNFERRLKIRISIANLESFRGDIEQIVAKLRKGEIYTWDSEMQRKEENAIKIFLEKLEKRLRTEKGLGIAAGGYGLEQLIKEIFDAKGYEADIPAKNARPAGEDVDIIAIKEGELGSKGEKYLIQAKHHRGTTGRAGLDQLIACKDDEDETYFYRKILITTAKVDSALKDEAESHGIIVVEGKSLAEWVFDNILLLSKATLRRLGISEVPSLI